MRRVLAAWGTALVLVAGGCATHEAMPGHGHRSASQEPTRAPAHAQAGIHRLDCNVIGTGRPAAPFLDAFDTVAIAVPPGRALTVSAQPGATGVARLFGKAGLGFRLHTRWRLVVPPAARRHLRVGWGSPGVPGLGALPPRCPGELRSRTGWVWYPGGFWTDARGCYPVRVEARGRTTVLHIGLGTRCR